MKRELGAIPPREEVVKVLIEKYEKRLGPLKEASLNSEIMDKMKELRSWMTSEEFLLKKTPKIPKGVKIKGGVELFYGIHKAKGGLIRTIEEVSESRIEDITISGDFTFYPKERLQGLEKSLVKVSLEEDRIIERVENYRKEKKIESPGVESKDFALTILNPIKDFETG